MPGESSQCDGVTTALLTDDVTLQASDATRCNILHRDEGERSEPNPVVPGPRLRGGRPVAPEADAGLQRRQCPSCLSGT